MAAPGKCLDIWQYSMSNMDESSSLQRKQPLNERKKFIERANTLNCFCCSDISAISNFICPTSAWKWSAMSDGLHHCKMIIVVQSCKMRY